jgi:hypothetical protein
LGHGNASADLNGKPIARGIYTSKLALSCGATVSECEFWNCSIQFIGEYDSNAKAVRYSNIHFDNNRGYSALLRLPLNEDPIPILQPYLGDSGYVYEPTDLISEIHIENATIKDSGSLSGELLIPFAINGKVPIRGHLEVTGHYDLTACKADVATNVFPDPESTNRNVNWASGDICLYVYGDPLRYTRSSDGALVSMDPWRETNVGQSVTNDTENEVEVAFTATITSVAKDSANLNNPTVTVNFTVTNDFDGQSANDSFTAPLYNASGDPGSGIRDSWNGLDLDDLANNAGRIWNARSITIQPGESATFYETTGKEYSNSLPAPRMNFSYPSGGGAKFVYCLSCLGSAHLYRIRE